MDVLLCVTDCFNASGMQDAPLKTSLKRYPEQTLFLYKLKSMCSLLLFYKDNVDINSP